MTSLTLAVSLAAGLLTSPVTGSGGAALNAPLSATTAHELVPAILRETYRLDELVLIWT